MKRKKAENGRFVTDMAPTSTKPDKARESGRKAVPGDVWNQPPEWEIPEWEVPVFDWDEWAVEDWEIPKWEVPEWQPIDLDTVEWDIPEWEPIEWDGGILK